MTPWTDRSGTFSPLKATVFAGICMPAIWIAWRAVSGDLGPRPIDEAILRTGDWAIRFIWLSLAVTPLRFIAGWPKLIVVRRMLGVGAMCYALTHFTLYALDQRFDLARIASEIVLRFYLTIGFVAVVGLVALGATSTDAAIRRLGGNWNRLHKIVYLIAPLAAFHFFIQSKADVFEPTLMAGFLLLLMLYRVARWRGFAITSFPVLLTIAVVAALGTAAIEYAWYALATGVPPGRVLAANLQFSYSIRPAWWVLATGLALALVALVRPRIGGRQAAPRGRVSRATA
ncbi:protein-methionine-sulfoxide reductase heme-binding subunit MsrQ [Mesorhizobium sp. VNQ89]|uniref:sulfite oxidase heme-binding subunit YedZ n=1 Tax=Mesorhizobium quangtriensis TaxID=3157709 RepID=UPI0032B8257F